VIFASIVHGVDGQAAPSALKLWTTGGVDWTVHAVHEALPHVQAPVRMLVALPPVRIGVTVGVALGLLQATARIVQSLPKSFPQMSGWSLSLTSAGDAAPLSPNGISQVRILSPWEEVQTPALLTVASPLICKA